MIHFTVAAPLGIDSVFFSFIERLAVQNGHVCCDPPAQQQDEAEPSRWIEAMRRSAQHHFVIGYRYPPTYWKILAECASTVCLLADPDGISRQVEQIHTNHINAGGADELPTSIQAIRHALEATIGLAEWTLEDGAPRSCLIPPADAFIAQPKRAFTRLEKFYQDAGVAIHQSCSADFSEEALPLLLNVCSVGEDIRREIHRQLILEGATPQRLAATSAIFW